MGVPAYLLRIQRTAMFHEKSAHAFDDHAMQCFGYSPRVVLEWRTLGDPRSCYPAEQDTRRNQIAYQRFT